MPHDIVFRDVRDVMCRQLASVVGDECRAIGSRGPLTAIVTRTGAVRLCEWTGGRSYRYHRPRRPE